MDITIQPGKLSGNVQVIPSKSQAHRYLICAALSDNETNIYCSQTNRDMDATAACLNNLGASIRKTEWGYSVIPIQHIPEHAFLPCCDSGSTLRFVLPVAGALGVDAIFDLQGRLPQRPLSPLWEEMERMGCVLTRPTSSTIHCQGKLQSGNYTIDGGVSSQFITGLMLALPLLKEYSTLSVTGKLESKPYTDITRDAMRTFGICLSDTEFTGEGTYHSPGTVSVEGDWSNGAFFLAAQYLGNPVTIGNLNPKSSQGDRAVQQLLSGLEENIVISAADIPDLVPILSLVAACNQGASFTDTRRLRLKESDRVASVIQLLRNLGGEACVEKDTLIIRKSELRGGIVDSVNDHRIAMTAAIASTVCKEPVTILGAECVQKSYPCFWEEICLLGGQYEQHIR